MNDNFEQERPNPDVLLNAVRNEERKQKKGKLKIFFGMCAGVGKTYFMLQAGHKMKSAGTDVVIGLIETHKRQETERLTQNLERLPLKKIFYKGNYYNEFDTDIALTRKPEILLLDELAHSNIPGSKHTKRYKDVIELLDNGIDVYTTLNVQHLESRAETVKQITGTIVRETIPDSIIDLADEIELIDITTEELLERLSEGKVYTPESSRIAIQNFFRKGNLTALREMALRITAEKVVKELRSYRNRKNIREVWKSGQRLLCAVSTSPYATELIRWTRRLADNLEASWIAVYVETDEQITKNYDKQMITVFKLAEELGGEVVIIQDVNIVNGLIRAAKENSITQIVLGKTRAVNLFRIYKEYNFLNRLINKSGNIDIYVYGNQQEKINKKNKVFEQFSDQFLANISDYIKTSVGILLASIFFFLVKNIIGYESVSLLFLLIITILPLFKFSAGPVFLAALLSAAIWDFVFIPPVYTFHISKPSDVLMCITYLTVATVSGYFSTKIRRQRGFLEKKEKRSTALLNLSKILFNAKNINEMVGVTITSIEKEFNCKCSLLLRHDDGKLADKPCKGSSIPIDEYMAAIANWTFAHGRPAGKYTETLSESACAYYPLKSKGGILGVVAIAISKKFSFDLEKFFLTYIDQVATTFEREYLNYIANQSILAVESEKLYKTLFDSLSHELKIPITSITAAANSISFSDRNEKISSDKMLLEEIKTAVLRLDRLVENLLDMARLESGKLKLKYTWNGISDVINSVLKKLNNELTDKKVILDIDYNIPIFMYDFALVEQALFNIIHNSILYTPPGSKIKISTVEKEGFCLVIVSDDGPGLPKYLEEKIFEKFYRLPGTKTGGLGLGLSIAKGFIQAHKGEISVRNLPGGGAEFIFKIPIKLN